LYVLPELFSSGYTFSVIGEVKDLAEPFGQGETFKAMNDFCRKRKSWVVYGFAERDGETFFNSAGLIGHDGTNGLYRKIHLFDREKLFFAPGNLPFQVFQTPVGAIGIMICFDWYFPESARTLALRGAQIIAHPSNLVLPHCPDSMPVRCLENRVFAATANRIGVEDRHGVKLTYIGQSQITSPKGEILHRSPSDKPEIAVREIDLSLAENKNINERNHLFMDRRSQFYA
ncbi:MAG: acyltransferase, partial [Ignavibacteriales bacterium]|nr:acyltransferase [Ignavibacteriales bacterium]